MFLRKKIYLLLVLLSVGLVFINSCKSKKATTASTSSTHKEPNKKAYYAKKFGVSLDRESNLKLYAAIDSWMGVKYKYASCTKAGIDCSCLVNVLYKEAYSCNTPRDTRALCEQIKKVDKDELKEGDLVFFKMKDGGKIDHVGVYLSNKKFVHASTRQGVMISDLDEPHFKKAYKLAGRLRCS